MTARAAAVKKHSMSTATRRRNRALILERDGNACYWCHAEFDEDTPPTIDHIVPRSLYGRDALWNLVLACEPCNSARGNRMPA